MVRFTLLALLPLAVLAGNIDESIMNQKRQGVNLSTGPSSSGNTPSSSGDSSAPSSSTSRVEPSSSSVPPGNTGGTSITSSASPTTSSSPTRTSSSTASSSVVEESFTQTVSTSLSAVTIYSTFTEDGQTRTSTQVSETGVAVTTSVRATGTVRSGDGNGDSGLSDSSKKIIGGVVGGVGGALLLGALAFTAWRIWGKKKNLHDDDLYDPNRQEKLSTSTDTQPFRSTLDQYHQPGPVNTASNF